MRATLEVLAPSGNPCYVLPLNGSDLCASSADGDSIDAIWQDGTYVLRRGCEHRWWPQILRPAD